MTKCTEIGWGGVTSSSSAWGTFRDVNSESVLDTFILSLSKDELTILTGYILLVLSLFKNQDKRTKTVSG